MTDDCVHLHTNTFTHTHDYATQLPIFIERVTHMRLSLYRKQTDLLLLIASFEDLL